MEHDEGGEGPASLLLQAELHLDEEEVDDCLGKAANALSLYRKGGDSSGVSACVLAIIRAFNHQGRFKEALELATQEKALCAKFRNAPGEARMVLGLAETSSRISERAAALSAAVEALGTARLVKDQSLEAQALLAVVNARLQLPGLQKKQAGLALQEAREALELAQSCADQRLQGRALHAISAARISGGNVESGARAAKDALKVFCQMGMKRLEVNELQCIATSYVKLGTPEKGQRYAEEAVAVTKRAKFDLGWQAKAVGSLMAVLVAAGDAVSALEHGIACVKACREAGDRAAEAAALEALITAHLGQDSPEGAIAAATAASNAWRDLGEPCAEAAMLRVVAQVHLQQRGHEHAVRAATRSLEIYRACGGGCKERIGSLSILIESLLASQLATRAAETAKEERELFQAAEDRQGEAASVMALLGVHMETFAYREAAALAADARRLFRSAGDKAGEAAASQVMVQSLMADSQPKAALEEVDVVLPLIEEVGSPQLLATTLLAGAQASTLLLVEGGGDPSSHVFRESANRAAEWASKAVLLGKQLGDHALLGAALCTKAQVNIMLMNGKEAERTAVAAVSLFRGMGERSREAYAMLMHANTLIVTCRPHRAGDVASQAAVMFRQLKDLQGEAYAEAALEAIERPPERDEDAALLQVVSRSDMGGQETLSVDAQLIQSKVRSTVIDIVGIDDIYDDTPLMQTGLTSQSAVLLRNTLTKELPGPSLPFTMMFDFPSISDLTNFFVRRST